MKNKRQALILELINTKDIETQEELADILASMNVNVTQATISRDIKDLRIVKAMGDNGKYKYIVNTKVGNTFVDRLVRIFAESIISFDYSKNIIVLKTISGSANVASEAIDNMKWPEIIGSIAGDNTILLVVKNEEDVVKVIEKIEKLKSTK